VVEANCPVKIALLDGAQNTPGQCALLKETPRLANLSMLGVFACLCPIAPTQSHKSSTAKNITLGGESFAKSGEKKLKKSASKNADDLFICTRIDHY